MYKIHKKVQAGLTLETFIQTQQSVSNVHVLLHIAR